MNPNECVYCMGGYVIANPLKPPIRCMICNGTGVMPVETCSFHKDTPIVKGRCEMCDDLDAALDREFGR